MSEQAARPAGAGGLLAPVLLAGAALAVSAPTLRLFPPFPDEGALLTGAAVLGRGGVFFRDVDAFPLPGAWFLLSGVMRLFGESLVVARALDAALFAVAVVLAYLVGRQVMGRFAASLLGVTLLAVKYWAWPMWSFYFYADLAICLALGGILAALRLHRRGSPAAALVAGACFGAAAVCKQTVGIYPGLVGGLLLVGWAATGGKWPGPPLGGRRRPWALLVAYAAGIVAAVGAPFAWFAAQGLGRAFVLNGLVRPFTGYLPLSGTPYAPMLRLWEFGRLPNDAVYPYLPPLGWSAVFIGCLQTGTWSRPASLALEAAARLTYLLAPLACLAACWWLWQAARRGREGTAAAGLTACLLAGSAALSTLPRADYAHLLNVAPLWLIGVFLACDQALRRLQPAAGRAMRGLLLLGAAGLALGGVAMLLALYRACPATITLPRAGALRVYEGDRAVQTVTDYVRSHTRPGEPLFVYGQEAYYYFLTDRYSGWAFPQVYPGMTGRGGGGELVRLLEKERPRYIVRGHVGFAMVPPVHTYAPALDAYVKRHYRPLAVTPGGIWRPDTVLERLP